MKNNLQTRSHYSDSRLPLWSLASCLTCYSPAAPDTLNWGSQEQSWETLEISLFFFFLNKPGRKWRGKVGRREKAKVLLLGWDEVTGRVWERSREALKKEDDCKFCWWWALYAPPLPAHGMPWEQGGLDAGIGLQHIAEWLERSWLHSSRFISLSPLWALQG